MIFGCGVCFPDGAEAAWAARRNLATVAPLVSESHVSVWVGACGSCGQHFVSVFTERIDWVNGEDPQDWALMPVTGQESAALRGSDGGGGGSGFDGSPFDGSALRGIGVGRRCLRAYHPSDDGMRVFWSEGPAVIGPHD